MQGGGGQHYVAYNAHQVPFRGGRVKAANDLDVHCPLLNFVLNVFKRDVRRQRVTASKNESDVIPRFNAT